MRGPAPPVSPQPDTRGKPPALQACVTHGVGRGRANSTFATGLCSALCREPFGPERTKPGSRYSCKLPSNVGDRHAQRWTTLVARHPAADHSDLVADGLLALTVCKGNSGAAPGQTGAITL